LVTGLSTLSELEKRIREDPDLRWNTVSIKRTLEEMLNQANARPEIPGLEDIKRRDFEAAYGPLLNEIVTDDKYADDKILPKSCITTFKNVVFTAITHQLSTPFSTGLVIAGYGHEDLYPKLFEMSVDGGFLNFVRCYDVDSCDISKDPNGAKIATFAQDDTVQAFLSGIDEKFKIFCVGLFTHLMGLISKEILREHSNMNSDERRVALAMIERSISDSFEDFQNETEAFAEKEFRKPVLEVLRTAPKETLAELAESLVSLTSLRQRVSGELETVGGPVDVALISKGEGVIWIKRKQYFNMELNPHYTHNYFKEIE
jgi:hypothetical protein